jgi:hypothetical protein
MYNLNDQRTTPTEILTGGRAVQLDGSRGHLPSTVEVFGAKGNKVVLLVVPFHTHPEQGHAIVTASFSDVSTDDMPGEAVVSRRMLRRLEDIDHSTTPGPPNSSNWKSNWRNRSKQLLTGEDREPLVGVALLASPLVRVG